MISLLTATGARPEAFKLCETWMKRQTLLKPPSVPEAEWVIVDDGDPITLITQPHLTTRMLRPHEKWAPGENTQGRNLLLGLRECRGEYIAIIEDDDWYDPLYLERMYEKIQEGFDLVGEAKATFYNVKERKWKRLRNLRHAGLCQSMFNRKLVPVLEEAIESGVTFFDFALWELANEKKFKTFLFPRAELVIGIKGMPGREGIGQGHKIKGAWNKDTGYSWLKKFIGADVFYYRELFEDARKLA